MSDEATRFRGGRLATELRYVFATGLDLTPADVDRLALALAVGVHGCKADHGLRAWLAQLAVKTGLQPMDDDASGEEVELDRVDDFAGHAYLRPLLAEEGVTPQPLAKAARTYNAGYRYLSAIYEAVDRDAAAALASVVQALGNSEVARAAVGGVAAHPSLVQILLGKDAQSGARVDWAVNAEDGQFSQASVRIVGDLGKGKSQALLGFLSAITEASPQTGFVLLDYKGDLAKQAEFVKATKCKVIRPSETPIPINPFDLGKNADLRLAPVRFAGTLAALDKRIGEVQKGIVERGLTEAYAASRQAGKSGPTLGQARDEVRRQYKLENRGDDTVTSLLDGLADHGFFSPRSTVDIADIFTQRWLIDLSGLGELRTRVAFLLLHFLHETAAALGDSAFDPAQKTRALRGIVAVDEAHYYLRQGVKCQPLLELLRIGRSKGVPVFLSSQSLDDFKGETELQQLMPNTFMFCQGSAPDLRTLEGALRVDRKTAQALAVQALRLEQHTVLTPHNRGADDVPRPLRLTPFYERVSGQ